MRNRNGWIALSLILTPPLSLRETLLRKSVVTELGYLFPESHPPFSLSLAAPQGPDCRWLLFFIISPACLIRDTSFDILLKI